MLSQSLTTGILSLTDTQSPVTLRDFGLMTSTCNTQRQRSLMRSISNQSFRRLAAMRRRLQELKNLTVFIPHISRVQGLIEWTFFSFYWYSCLRVGCFLFKNEHPVKIILLYFFCQNDVELVTNLHSLTQPRPRAQKVRRKWIAQGRANCFDVIATI